jgi:hypothetical protein
MSEVPLYPSEKSGARGRRRRRRGGGGGGDKRKQTGEGVRDNPVSSWFSNAGR